MADCADLFLSHSTETLKKMSSWIESCLARLSDEQIWARGGENENSVGNLVLHLCGNARQWICSGIGGDADTRNRDSEFAASGGMRADELRKKLSDTVGETATVLEKLEPNRLTEHVTVQDRTLSVLEAIYHVVGHFQQHTGQIVFATKVLSGEDLGLQRPKAKSA